MSIRRSPKRRASESASSTHTTKRPRPNTPSETAGAPQINPTAVCQTLADPTTWSCATTGMTDDVWLCLGDGRVVSKGKQTKNAGGGGAICRCYYRGLIFLSFFIVFAVKTKSKRLILPLPAYP